MAFFDFTRRGLLRVTAAGGVLALGGLVADMPAGGLRAASPAAPICKFAPFDEINRRTGSEPRLMIDGTCIDPDYNEKTFVVDKTEEKSFQMPDGGPLIPYTEVTGHFPATRTYATLPPEIRNSVTVRQQNYMFRFPAKQYWKNRSFQQQHPTGGGVVDNRLAFSNGAFSVSWMSAGVNNAGYSPRHEAAATLVAKAMANKLYGNSAKIYSYFWGCSGGGIVAMGAAENTSGIWDGIGVHCMGPSGVSSIHSFHWQALYTMGIPKAKRDAIAEAALPGGTGDIYAGLEPDEKELLNEFISAGYPLPVIWNHFNGLSLPLVDPISVRINDPSYENDFWSVPGYAGVKPPRYLQAAMVDGWATITDIKRDAAGAITELQFDPATVPKLGTTGDNYLEYWVYSPDGKTRLIDPSRPKGQSDNPRFSLQGRFDPAKATLTLAGTRADAFGNNPPYVNRAYLTDALKVGGKVRINNRFILAIYFYPRYSNIPGQRSYDQYRNADGSARYPQRKDISILAEANYGTMGGRAETGAITTKVMIIEGRSDNLSWPLFNSSYAEQIQRRLGKAKADQMMRFYLHDNGRHAVGGGEPGIWAQALQDLMAWAEKGVAPPPSTAYTVRNGQVVPPDSAAERHGLQPVMSLTVNGGARAVVGINQPVDLVSTMEMPPRTGMLVQYGWSVVDAATPPPPPTPGARPSRSGGAAVPGSQGAGPPSKFILLDKPQTRASVSQSMKFDKPGVYIVRLTVNGQRDGQVNPANQTLMQNFKEVRVVVQ